MPYLIVRQPGRMAISVVLRDELRIGRHEQNDLVLEDQQVSRQHAVLRREGDTFELRDVGSRHGTRVNGARTTQKLLAAGDQIQMGNVLIEFRGEEDSQEIVHRLATAAGPPLRDARADRRLHLIYDVSRAIGSLEDTGAMLGEMLEAIVEVVGCERAFVGLGTPEQGITRRFVRTRGASEGGELVVSRAVIEATLERREALIARDLRREPGPKTMVKERIVSAMAVPLGLRARPMGFLYVDDRQFAERFTTEDLAFLTALGHLVAAALESAARYQRAEAMAEVESERDPTRELVGESVAMRKLKAEITKYAAAAHAHVLVRGESGSGKELVARALHAASPRVERPFVTLNCAAIPESMIESELFGYEKGAFTGALKSKRGKFALADGGTLFLDEIGDLALPAQAKLLRAIQEGEIQALGSERSTTVDVRIVSATHKDLLAEVGAKRFREDLYYRLNVIEIVVPPLREREGDVGRIAEALLKRAAGVMGKRLEGFSKAALAALEKHDWPGNVRELRNEIERAVINAEEPFVDAHDLHPRLGAAKAKPEEPRGQSLAERFAELEPTERELVETALREAQGNISEAARLLGITRIMMRRRVERFGLKGRDE